LVDIGQWPLALKLSHCERRMLGFFLFSEAIPTARDRAIRFDALLDHYGQIVNPKYSRIIERIRSFFVTDPGRLLPSWPQGHGATDDGMTPKPARPPAAGCLGLES
jgi:hypothetical protein